MPELDTTSISDDVDLLGTDENDEQEETDENGLEPEVEEEPEEEESEESTESDESEEESEETDEEVDIPFNRPSVKDIKEKYPNFFKDFPDLKEAFFREQKFTSFFPTIEDAQEALENNEAFQALSDATIRGEASPILESLEKTDPKAFETYCIDFLPSLFKKNQDVYNTVVTPLFENLLRTLYKSTDENMKNSALNVASYIFGEEAEASLQGKKTLSKVINISEEQKKLRETNEQVLTNKFLESSRRVETRLGKSLEKIIGGVEGKEFDPNKTFTPFIRKQLIAQVIKDIGNQLKTDKGHMAVMAARWKAARGKGFSAEEESKIIATYLARAKSLIPSTRQRIINQALGKKAATTKIDKTKTQASNKDAPLGGRTSRVESQPTSRKDYSKMSDLEILAS